MPPKKHPPKNSTPDFLGQLLPISPGVNLPRAPRPAKVMLEEAAAGGEFQTAESKVKGEEKTKTKRPKRMDVRLVGYITPKVGYITPKVGYQPTYSLYSY